MPVEDNELTLFDPPETADPTLDWADLARQLETLRRPITPQTGRITATTTNVYYHGRYQTLTEPETATPTTPDIWPDLPNTLEECLTDDQKLRLVLKAHCGDIELTQRIYHTISERFEVKYMELVW